MATSIGQYAQSSCLGNPASLTEKPGRPQSQGRKESDTTQATLCTQGQDFFAWGSSALVRVEREGGAAAGLVGTLAAPSVQGHGRLHRRS